MLVTLKVVGVEAPSSQRRKDSRGGVGVRVYGYLEHDTAERLCGIEISERDAVELVQDFNRARTGDFPDIEIEDKYVFRLAVLGAGEGLFKKGPA